MSLASIATLLTLATLFVPRAQARDPGARVLWAAGERLYVAVPDSGALAVRMRVRVLDRDREVARGEVASVLDGSVASVRLEAPLDARVRPDQYARLDVVLEVAPPRVVAMLRVGLPAPGRRALAPPCDDARLDAAALPRPYREERLAADAVRLIADTLVVDSTRTLQREPGAWPETLLVRFFADRADEEIALERGELDAALFWPGEPSARLRDHTAGFELLRGLRSRGVIVSRSEQAAIRGVPRERVAARRTATDLSALNAEMFAGDLLPIKSPAGSDPGDSAAVARMGERLVDYTLDSALPGAPAIGRFLNSRARPLSHRHAPEPIWDIIHVEYRDVPVAAEDPVAAGRFSEVDVSVFALRCPVICAAARVADVRALGADRLANLIACGRREGAR